jgi:hypothetical protein
MDPLTSEFHFDSRLLRRNVNEGLISREQIKKNTDGLRDDSDQAAKLEIPMQWGTAREKLLARALREQAEAANEEQNRREAEDQARLDALADGEDREFPEVEESFAEVAPPVFDGAELPVVDHEPDSEG